MDAPIGWANGGWANDQGYVMELQIGVGQHLEIDPEALFGFAALPFYGSPLPADFFAAAPPPAPALPADLVGAAAAIHHGLDDFENMDMEMDVDVLHVFAELPFYVNPLTWDDVASRKLGRAPKANAVPADVM